MDLASTGFEDDVLASTAYKQVRNAVADLPTPHRQAILLAYYHGLTYREVAEALSIPEGTAKWRLRNALRRIGEQLAAEASRTASTSSERSRHPQRSGPRRMGGVRVAWLKLLGERELMDEGMGSTSGARTFQQTGPSAQRRGVRGGGQARPHRTGAGNPTARVPTARRHLPGPSLLGEHPHHRAVAARGQRTPARSAEPRQRGTPALRLTVT